MSEREASEREADVDGDAGGPEVEPSISAGARFTIGGKPVELGDFIDITTGDMANRPAVEAQPQPTPMPKEVVWNSRRPLDD